MAAACIAPQPLPSGSWSAKQRRCWRQAAASSPAPTRQQGGQRWELAVHRGYVPDAVEVSKLIASAFVSGDEEDGASLTAPARLQYQLKLLAALQWRASTMGRAFVTVTAVDAASGELAGVANISPGLALAEAEGHVELGPGEAAVTISGLAVAEQHRRRGLGRRLLAACEAAACQASPPATLVGLCVYCWNEAAVQLYESAGYLPDDAWVDQRWADSAERGRVGFQRRQLMLKPIGQDAEQWWRQLRRRRRRRQRQAEQEQKG